MQYKTFLATCNLTGGVILVVLVRIGSSNWAAYFSTDVTLSSQQIIKTAAAR